MQQTILEVKNLTTSFKTERGVMKAIDGINFRVNANEILGIVGESGCGKSVTCQSIMRLYDEKYTVILRGEILFKGENLLKYSGRKMQSIRGDEISMVFQDALSALNPVMRVGDQIMEAIKLHNKGISKQEARERALNILKLVGIPAYKERFSQYPHELSGGMRQRVMIAIALLCDPELLIADEPTTALDVTIQAQILDLLRSINEKLGTSIILITHDLGVVASMVDTVAVMYCGHIVEKADVRTIFQHPLHPYTEGLLRSIPHMDDSQGDLATIEGSVPSIYHMPEGCAFHNRCACCRKICTQKQPPLLTLDGEHTVQCWKYTPQWDEEGGSDHV